MTKKRFILYQKMDKIIIDEANNSFVLWQVSPIHQKRGLRINPLNLLSFKSKKKNILNRNNQMKSYCILSSFRC
jgi:hypothetical protein